MEQPVAYLDSMVFILALEGNDRTALPARKLLGHLLQKPGSALTSDLSLAEVMAPVSRNGDIGARSESKSLPFELRQRLYWDLMTSGNFLTFAAVTREILLETADLRRVAPNKLPDAIHVVTAMRYGCRFLVSADDKLRVPEGITKIAPDGPAIAQVIKAVV